MDFSAAARLLDPAPLHLEMGIERLPSGVLHVAAHTDMHGCAGRMFDWWFRWFHTTQHYTWWHPVDHVASAWQGWAPGRYVGATNVGDEPLRDAQGRPIGGRLIHVARDTAFGCVLRSHFWIGQDLAGVAPPEAIAEVATEELGFGLLRHAYNEMSFLARFLPSLYVAENRATERPALPWEV